MFVLTCSRPAARILAVEDDPLLASHLLQHLQDSGYCVTLSRDGREGLRLAAEGDLDLVLMDSCCLASVAWRPCRGYVSSAVCRSF